MLSVIIPFHNEEENIPILHQRLTEVLHRTGHPYEILFVDDGSQDNSAGRVPHDEHTRLIRLNRQMGKGRALAAGVAESRGDIVFFMDGDLEDDPREIPRFLEKLEEGNDLVNGVRTGRKHSGIIRIYSALANRFIHHALHSPFTDINCGYKCMRRVVLKEIPLYGNNFRFFPLAAFYEGFRVSEIPVRHTRRVHGVSKFGSGKLFIGLIDTITAYFLYRFAERPLHFFGAIGFWLGLAGTAILGYLGVERIIFQHEIYRRPILFLGMLLVIIGVQIAATGLLAELMVYSKNKRAR
ncbi:MAG: glycosyltransferase family 2 protein [Patescibacteria group bacterium]|nr:glycosyltransferase family 2 protein [Patescibacteria group bacterium]